MYCSSLNWSRSCFSPRRRFCIDLSTVLCVAITDQDTDQRLSFCNMSAFTVPVARLIANSRHTGSHCFSVCRAHARVQSRLLSCSASSVSFDAAFAMCWFHLWTIFADTCLQYWCKCQLSSMLSVCSMVAPPDQRHSFVLRFSFVRVCRSRRCMWRSTKKSLCQLLSRLPMFRYASVKTWY